MIKVTLNSLQNANDSQKQFSSDAIAIIERIVNDSSFREQVLNGNYSYRIYLNERGNYENADNNKIWAIISGGMELNQTADGEIDFQCEFAKLDDDGDVMGRVIPPKPLITTNTVWLKWIMSKNDPLSLAAHWIHEWMHVAGFVHPKKESVRRNDVTYTVGKIALSVGRKILSGGQKSAAFQMLGIGYEEAVETDFCDVLTETEE